MLQIQIMHRGVLSLLILYYSLSLTLSVTEIPLYTVNDIFLIVVCQIIGANQVGKCILKHNGISERIKYKFINKQIISIATGPLYVQSELEAF